MSTNLNYDDFDVKLTETHEDSLLRAAYSRSRICDTPPIYVDKHTSALNRSRTEASQNKSCGCGELENSLNEDD